MTMQPDVYRHAWFFAGQPINTQYTAGTPYGVIINSVEGLDGPSDISENRLTVADGTDIVGASAYGARTITITGTIYVYDPSLNASVAGATPAGYIPYQYNGSTKVVNNLQAARSHFERFWNQFVGPNADEQLLQFPREDAPDAPLTWLTPTAYAALQVDEAAALLGQTIHFAGIDFARCWARPTTRVTWGAVTSPYMQDFTLGLKSSSAQIAIDNGVLVYSSFTGETATTCPTPAATSPGFAIEMSGRGLADLSVQHPGIVVADYNVLANPVTIAQSQVCGIPYSPYASGENQVNSSSWGIDTMREKNGLRLLKKGLAASALNDQSTLLYAYATRSAIGTDFLGASLTGNPGMAGQKLATVNITKVGTWSIVNGTALYPDTFVSTTAGTPSLKYAPASYVLNPPYIVRGTYVRWDSTTPRTFGGTNLMTIVGAGGTINPFSIDSLGDLTMFGFNVNNNLGFHVFNEVGGAANPLVVVMTCLVTATQVVSFYEIIYGAAGNAIYTGYVTSVATLPGAFQSVQVLPPTVSSAGDPAGGWAEIGVYDGTLAPAQSLPVDIGVGGTVGDSWLKYPYGAFSNTDQAYSVATVNPANLVAGDSVSLAVVDNTGGFSASGLRSRMRVMERIA